jgi:hypothetical protein
VQQVSIHNTPKHSTVRHNTPQFSQAKCVFSVLSVDKQTAQNNYLQTIPLVNKTNNNALLFLLTVSMQQPQQQQQQDDVLKALHSAAGSEESQIRHMKVLMKANDSDVFSETSAYFLATKDAVKFRHEGEIENDGLVPPVLYLADKSNFKGKILVSYSSSGSGKTSELVGSSASRGSHLTFLISVHDDQHIVSERIEEEAKSRIKEGTTAEDISDKELTSPSSQQVGSDDVALRNRFENSLLADHAIQGPLNELINDEAEHLNLVFQAALGSNQRLKFVLAIDEASSCPKVIRGVLRFPKKIKELVADCLFDGLQLEARPDFDLEISIAGTGVETSTIGSLPETFHISKPSHEEHHKIILADMLRRNPLCLIVPWSETPQQINLEIIEKELPVLATMMGNGRLASIALAKLRQCEARNEEVKEGVVANSVIRTFMTSNGMSNLVGDAKEQRLVAASALAVHLFSQQDHFKKEVPDTSEGAARFAEKMDFFDFSTQVTVKGLVTTYGLLEPSRPIKKEHRGNLILPPVQMSTPQQLVAVFMLGLNIHSMLEPTWFGFELMSTHFVKCAIAASAAVCKEKRPSVQFALESLGIVLDNNPTNDVTKTWEGMDTLYPVFSKVPANSEKDQYYQHTRQLEVGLGIVDTVEHGEVLQIESKLRQAINQAYPPNSIGITGNVAPISFVNEGNSDLFDGGVTFWALHGETSKEGKVTLEHREEKVTIEIQAKDYHGQSKVDATKLNEHSAKVGNPLLDKLFGSIRLLCVSSPMARAVMSSTVALNKRNYMPYVVERSSLLTTLLSDLQQQRWRKWRIEKYACFYNANDEEVTNFRLASRKPKRVVEGDDGGFSPVSCPLRLSVISLSTNTSIFLLPFPQPPGGREIF